MSYDPNAFLKMMIDMANLQVDQLSVWQQYVSGSTLLTVSWLFLLGTFLLWVYPVYAIITGYMGVLSAVCYMLGLLIITIPASLWVIALLPCNAVKNDGTGTTVLHDLVFSSGLKPKLDKFMFAAFGAVDFTDYFLGVDLLVLSWSLFFVSLVGLVSALGYVIWEPAYFVSYLWLGASVTFCIGAFLFSHSLYPENSNSKSCWMVTCRCLCCCGHCGDKWYREEDDEDDCPSGAGGAAGALGAAITLEQPQSQQQEQEKKPSQQQQQQARRKAKNERTALLGYKKNSDPSLGDDDEEEEYNNDNSVPSNE
jgi:hypothetical protein